MTRQSKRRILTVSASLLGLLALVAASSLIVCQTEWFSDLVRNRVISALEDATGGSIDIGSFQLDPLHLTVRVHNLTLHGTESRTVDPLLRISFLELRLKLLSGFKSIVDLSYLEVAQPRFNIIVNSDGSTNIPEPKVKTTANAGDTLKTVVDLAVGTFRIENGVIAYSQRKDPINIRGENLRAFLQYNGVKQSYVGYVRIDPLTIAYSSQPPLLVHVSLPLGLDKDGLSFTNASFTTALSQVHFDASVKQLNSPRISVKLGAQLSASEMAATFGMPLDRSARDILYADIDGQFDPQTKSITLPEMHVRLGKTVIDASGQGQTIQFRADLALGEMSRLFRSSLPQMSGDLLASGTATTDTLSGMIESRGLAFRNGSTQLSLSTPFRVTTHAASLDAVKLRSLGGTLVGSVVIDEFRNLTAKGNLHALPLSAISSALTGRSLGYDGAVEGSISANADLRSKGTSGITASALLKISPGRHDVPVRGALLATYSGKDGSLDLKHSYLSLPHSRVDFSGKLGGELEVNATSRNLNDFLPLMNLSSSKPARVSPVNVDTRGEASLSATVEGELARARITANGTMSSFTLRDSHFDKLALNILASPAGFTISDGLLSSQAFDSTFDASVGLLDWRLRGSSPLSVNLALKHGGIRPLLALAGTDDNTAKGDVTANVRVAGTYGNPLGSAAMHASAGEAYGQPFQRADARVNLSDRLVRLESLEIALPGGTFSATASFRHPTNDMTSGHAEVQASAHSIQLNALSGLLQASAGITGVIQLEGKAAADIAHPSGHVELTVSNIDADASAQSLRLHGEDAGALTASVHTASGNFVYKAASNFAGSNLSVEGHTALAADHYTKATAAISNLPVRKALDLANWHSIPVTGVLSANARIDGSLDSPDVDLNLDLTKAVVYLEPVTSLAATLHYNHKTLDIASLTANAAAGTLKLSGRYDHDADLYRGVLALHVQESQFDLAKIKNAQLTGPGIAGTLRFAADLSANVFDRDSAPQFIATNVNGSLSGKGLRMAGRNLGGFTLSAHTANSKVSFQLESDLAQSQIQASGEAQLIQNYPARASLTFKNVRYENIAPFLGGDSASPPLFQALVEGQASLNGPLLDIKALSAHLELSQIDLRTNPHITASGGPAARTVDFHNQGSVVVTLDQSVARIDSLHIRGPQTAIDVSGSVNLADRAAPLDVSVNAAGDLGVLQNVSRSFYSSGSVALNTTVRGTFSDPLLNGKIELHNANINYADIPNGLSNGNGEILLNGTTATFQNVTAESGGGKIGITGFIGLSPDAVVYNVHARATKVRTRYAQVSLTASTNLALTGNSGHSLLAGTVSVQRVSYSSSSDIGSLLYSASAPPSSVTEPSSLLASMRLDVHVIAASDLRVATSFVEKLNLAGSLTVRGTAAQPGITGKILFTDGRLVFFGNTYDVRTGSISFYDATAIRPILDLSLETVAQGVDVVLGVTGPVSDMKLSYRSDPPLTFDQIVQLLATNTTPFDATIASQQPAAPAQSASQMGESAILGQAVANPLASRVQRVFGLSQFKIDPSIAGSNGQPSARVTLQQKVASNLTFTYITDVTQTNSEIVRVQLDLNSRTSAVALRDYNGNVSLELFYKFQVH